MTSFAQKIIELLCAKGVIDEKEYKHNSDTMQDFCTIEETIESIDDVIKKSKEEKRDENQQPVWECTDNAVECDTITPLLKYYKTTERLVNVIEWIFIISCFAGTACLMIIDVSFVFMSEMLPLRFYAIVGIFALSVTTIQVVLMLIAKKRTEIIEKTIGK